MEDSQVEVKERSRIHARFKGASWYAHPQEVIIGGAGGIGSWLALFLARQGQDVHIYDFDTVDELNLAGQLYGTDKIGKPKSQAIQEICKELAETQISVYNERITVDSPVAPVMFSAFDNMEARMIMFKRWQDYYIETLDDPNMPRALFIDGRLNAETAEFFCVYDESTCNRWLESWFPDEKVEDAPCTYKATSHCAAVLTGLMTAAMNNFVANKMEGEMRSVPFRTSIWLPTITITSED